MSALKMGFLMACLVQQENGASSNYQDQKNHEKYPLRAGRSLAQSFAGEYAIFRL